MSVKDGWYRLVCRFDDAVVSVSEPLTKEGAMALFAIQVASGGYHPAEGRRALVLSEQEYAKSLRPVKVVRAVATTLQSYDTPPAA